MGETFTAANIHYLKQFLKENVISGDVSRLEEDLKKTITLSKRKVKKKTKKKDRKLKFITRKEKKTLGLFQLPKKGMRYEDVLPMNQMWKDYMRHQLDIGTQPIPKVEEKAWESFSQAIFKSDFHGALFSVTKSKCPSLVGICGICIIETKNTFKLLSRDNIIRTIPKEESAFTIHLDDWQFTVYGKYIKRRPAERSVKIPKAFMLPDL